MTLDLFFNNFHFVRPLWLWGIPSALLLGTLLWQVFRSRSGWESNIDPSLLSHLIETTDAPKRHRTVAALVAGWVIACIAIAGPTWEKRPQSVHKRADALVLILDLSLSMYSEDLKPSRITKAHHKLLDILKQRKEGLTALIAYSADAHTVTPLTDDTGTISAMVSVLTPAIMPAYGSNSGAAVKQAVQLLKETGLSQGQILILTDNIDQSQQDIIEDFLADKKIDLSIMGVGTEEGAPVPLASSGFLKDNGTIVLPKLNRDELRRLSSKVGGRYADLRFSDSDIAYLLPKHEGLPTGESTEVEKDFDLWYEQGHWLALLLAPFAALAFRRGWIFSLTLALLLSPKPAQALDWDDLWKNNNQQAQEAFHKENYDKASKLFQNKDWQGSAQYRDGKFENAEQSFTQTSGIEQSYNKGNALAKQKKYQEAIDAYNETLAINPDHEDALFNKKLLEDLLKNPNQQNQDQQDQDQENQEQQQSDNNENNSDSSQGGGQSNNQQDSQDNQDNQGDPEKDKPEDQDDQGDQGGPDQDQPQDQSGKEGDQETEQEQEQQGQETAANNVGLSDEEQQALEQWLRKIPDEPGALLRKKFQYQYQQQKNQPQKDGPIW